MEQTICLKDLLPDSTKEAKVGEFRKIAESKLEGLNKAVDNEEESYRTERPNLLKSWSDQDEKIGELKKHLESCYPKWEYYLEEAVCKGVIQKVWQLKADYEAKIGPPELELYHANADLAKAAEQMEAWKTIKKWIQARLDANKQLHDEICTLDNCKDRLFALYLFYFLLLPYHRQLKEAPTNLPPKLKDPETGYCKSACSIEPPKESAIPFCGYPWLIEADLYNCKLAEVWKIWKDAGVAQAEAQSQFDQVAKSLEEYQAASKPEAKREAAREALRRHDEDSQPPPVQQRQESTTQQPQT